MPWSDGLRIRGSHSLSSCAQTKTASARTPFCSKLATVWLRYRQANQLPFQIEKLIVQLKQERPSWGAPKIRKKLRRPHSDIQTPAVGTVHAVLYRYGLVNRGRKRRHKTQGTTLSKPVLPNDL